MLLARIQYSLVGLAAVLSVVSRSAPAAEPAASEAADYVRDVKPLLAAHCVKCHGPQKQENGLRLDAVATILNGGDSGPAVVAEKSAESLLILAVTGKSDFISRMPPEGPPS